jgi:hypothetical protein
MSKLEKIFGNPKNQVESDIAAFISPLMSESDIENAIKKKLTLSGCFKYTHDKAKPKSGNVATPSYMQIMKWSCEYFGISTKGLKIPDAPGNAAASAPPTPEHTEPSECKSGKINMDFDTLLD